MVYFMANIQFVKGYDGERQAYKFIFEQVAQKAIDDPDYRELANLVTKAIKRIYDVGLMPEEELFETTRLDDAIYSIRPLMKKVVFPYGPLKLYSLRINYKRVFAFRAIFFIRYPNDVETFFFTKALLKTTDHSPEFNQAVKESQQLAHDYDEEVKRKKQQEN